MLTQRRLLGPASVALVTGLLVWALLLAGDELDALYSLNMATRASTYGFLFIGAAAGAFAAVETGLSRRQASSRLTEASGARPPFLVTVRRLTPVIGWFTAALIAVITSAAIRAEGPLPVGQVASVAVAAVGALWLSISMGAAAGRYLPFGLGPIAGAVSTYALYVPSVLSAGHGIWSVVPIMDIHPAPHSQVRPGAYLLGALALVACAALLIAFAGPRIGRPAIPVAAAVAAVAVIFPLALVSPRTQEAVFLAPANIDSECVGYHQAQLCVLAVDDRFLDSLQQGAALAWPVLRKYSLVPQRIAQVDALGSGSAPEVEVDVRNLDAGARATAANIIDGSVAGRCDLPTIEPVTAMPWEVIIGAVLRQEAGLPGGEAGAEPAQRLAALPALEREQQIREIIAAIKTCEAEHA